MSRVPAHTLEAAPDASRPMLDSILAAPGRVGRSLNLQAQLAHSTALDAGWTDTQLTEVFVCIALTVFVDSFVRYARTELDVPSRPVPAGA
jgi:hypothetical protein